VFKKRRFPKSFRIYGQSLTSLAREVTYSLQGEVEKVEYSRMSTPLVSIITPAYNAERFLRATFASVQSQSFGDWEMIVVNDGSKDDTAGVGEALSKQDSRLKFHSQKNAGPAAARNLALSKARGRFIAFLDSDDIWLPRKLETQLEFMTSKNAAISFTQYRRFIDEPSNTGRLIDVPETVTYRQLLSHNVIATLTTMVDRDQSGPLQMPIAGYDDFALWLSILKKGFPGFGLKQDLSRYRIVPGSVSSKKLRAAKWVWEIYRDHEHLTLPYAAFQFAQYAVKVSLKHSSF
jgi:teichuronic acid biosynthesis glycosyltransferase TuaG